MYTLGYDFGDTFVPLDELAFAVRLVTVDNVYAPDPERTVISGGEEGATLQAEGLIWGGGQGRAEGRIRLDIRRGRDGRYIVEAEGGHGGETCRSLLLQVLGIDIAAMTYDRDKREEPGPLRSIRARQYPGFGMKMPLVFLEDTTGANWYAMTKDEQVRAKRFAVHYEPYREAFVLDLVHEEDARRRSRSIVAPLWHIGSCTDRDAIVRERCRDLERHFGLRPFTERTDSPKWLSDIQLVAILHGEHWTGHVFNTFAEMERILEWMAARIDGRRVLVFLPAWDGRYYYNYPRYEPGERLGGAEGLRRLIDTAKRLGMRTVPMLGANAVNLRQSEELGLRQAAVRDEWGNEKRIDWVDWDYDLAAEGDLMLANLGNPDYRRHLLDSADRIVNEYGVDGIFLDISSYWANDPTYSPYEGTLAWAREIRRRHPELLLFGENSYDALWAAFSLFHEGGGPSAHARALYRYARQTHYLAYPAPGRGSLGVNEYAWNWSRYPANEQQLPELIPTVSFVRDTLAFHSSDIEEAISRAKAWTQPLPEIAGGEAIGIAP